MKSLRDLLFGCDTCIYSKKKRFRFWSECIYNGPIIREHSMDDRCPYYKQKLNKGEVK